jgi:hypothetical protein
VSAQVYEASAAPVEDFYRRHGLLLDFEITGGIPETTPRLMAALDPYIMAAGVEDSQHHQQQQQAVEMVV